MYRNLFVFLILNTLYSYIGTTTTSCPSPELFECKNKRCISPLFRCDGENDCGDASDESDCHGFTLHPEAFRCASDEFQCKDHSCIPSEKFCDAKLDCSDESDEYKGCVNDIKCDTFRCKDGYCVRNEWVCDGFPDCPDNSDEQICDMEAVPIDKCNNIHDRYLCKNQRCISLNATCNEKNDCGDNSDENIVECKKADSSCRQTMKCEHNCRKTPEGAQCSCRSGYKLMNNGTCTDVNECEEIYGICDQRCINSPGSYTCACQSGYALSDNKKACKAEGGEPVMVFSIKSGIHGYYLTSEIYYPVAKNLQYAVAVSLDANYVYWSDIEDGAEKIIRSLEDGSQREVIVTAGLSSPEDMAVDWVTGNIYFTDSGYMHIGVCTNSGSYCSIIVKERNRKPGALALLPSNGIMYWTERGGSSTILMAGMDGKNRTVLIDQSLDWPSSLSIDYANNRLYWIDSKLKVIESIRLDGTDRRTILEGVAKKPFSLAVFENKLYWSDWMSNTIQSCDKFTGKDWKVLINSDNTIYGIHIYHSVLKPMIPNPCNADPCSQLCLLNSQNNYTCACTIDHELNPDNHTCRAVKKKMHLIIAAENTIIDYYHQLLGKPKMTSNNIRKVISAVTYNPLTGGLFVSDKMTGNISHLNMHTGALKTIMSFEDKVLGGMDFDYIGNNLYLTDIKHKTIEVHSLNTNEKTVFYFLEEPHDIALVPEEGIMMVVFCEDGKYRIDMMNMNGLGPRNTIEGKKVPLYGPKVSLRYDKDLKQLFWSDQGTGRIGSTVIPGFESFIFRTGLMEPVSLAIVDDHVFWTQRNSNELYWTTKSITHQYQSHVPLSLSHVSDKMQLVALRDTYVKEHECHNNNGNCSHVCLLSDSYSHICACPPNMMLSTDNRMCSPQTACNAGELKCSEHDKCIKSHQRCDGVADCPNGEDESSVCDNLKRLQCKSEDQFRCKNDECISNKKRCNHHYDCADRSDEEGCVEKGCDSNEFQCHEGACISKYFLCNGENDCSDFSDEINCAHHTCDSDSFACDTGACIPIIWKCDGEMDCPDGSDEGEMCQKHVCPSEMFTCTNGRCIDSIFKCNGISECEDNSDEAYCEQKGGSNHVNCTTDEYKCINTDMCLPQQVRCNGVQECPNNDDEHNCVHCQESEYVCDNKKCIDKSWICDRVDDCGDGSDERYCDGSNPKTNIIDTKSNCKEFQCSNGACLPFEKVCDQVDDCLDRSDEAGECAISCARNNPCMNICHKTPTGPVCSCRKGYKLGDDRKSCEDIDECEQNVCSQQCYNTNGSFICSCYEGYVVRNDKVSCKVAGPQMELITVAGRYIKKLTQSLSSIQVIYEEVNEEISGVDMNARDGSVYWSNGFLGAINKINIAGKNRETVIGLGRPEALAVDWITNNVYFNDNGHFTNIKVCNLEKQKCAEVVSTLIGKLTSIVVDPIHGWLFWSQTFWSRYSKPTSKIYRSDTTGTNETVIVHRDTGVVFAMAIDYTRSRLYWTDTFYKTIESSNLDGSSRKLFTDTGVHQALSISIHQDCLFWLVGSTGIVKKCKLYGDKSCTTISVGISNVDKHFTILHSARQPFVNNTCHHHKCEHMCVLTNHGPACICHNGYPKGPKDACTRNTDPWIKFRTSVAKQRTESRQYQNRTLNGVMIAALACIIIATAYFYYRRMKPNFSKKNNLSIHFHNPTNDHQNEIAASLNYGSSGLAPGEHEYVNPATQLKVQVENKNAANDDD